MFKKVENEMINKIKIILVSILLCTYSSTIVRAHSTQQTPFISNSLYNQPMIQDQTFKLLSRSEQDQMIKNHFIEHKKSTLKRDLSYVIGGLTILPMIAVGGYINRDSIKTAVNAFKAYHLRLIGPDDDQNPNEIRIAQTAMTFLTGGLSVASLGSAMDILSFSSFFIYRTLKNGLHLSEQVMTDPIESIELEYVLKKRFLPLGLQEFIENSLELSRIHSGDVQSLLHVIKLALNLPIHNKKIKFNQEMIEKLFENYPETLRQKVEAFSLRQVMTQAAQMNESKVEDINPGKRVAAFFYGIPGSGKTRFAELIAQALDVPFAQISLEGATISDLVGRPMSAANPTPGIIARAMINAKKDGEGAKNMVLLIDEADRIINHPQSGDADILPFMLKLLDPENKSFFNPYFNHDIDTSRLTIILAGNSQINDEALRKRLFVVKFEGFDDQFKKKIIWESTLPHMVENYSQNGKMDLSMSDITDEEHRMIDQCILSDQDPGFRTIENVLMSFLDYKAAQKYFDPHMERPDFMKMMKVSFLESGS